MKEISKNAIIGAGNTPALRELSVVVISHIIFGVLGILASRAVILGSLMPFGLSLVAGCPLEFLPSVAIGAFLSYFIPAVGEGGFRYIAALLAITAIRLMLSSFKKLSENGAFLGLISIAANLITGAVALGGVPIDAIYLLSEAVICAGTAYLINKVGTGIKQKGAGLTAQELGSLLILISILLLALQDITLYGVSLGRALGVLLLLTAAKYGGLLSGSVSGIAVYFCTALGSDFASFCGIYAVAGLLAGIFSALSKYAQAAAVGAAGLIGLALLGFQEGSGIFITEILVGIILFLAIPRGAGIILGKLFTCYPKITVANNVGKALTIRLESASCALRDVSDTVEQVSRELQKINSPDFGTVLSGIEQEACSGCKLRIHCWETKKDSTMASILSLINTVKQNDSTEDKPADDLSGRCLRFSQLKDVVTRRYTDYTSLLSAENRIEEVRQVVSDQFEGISNMLSELAEDFKCDQNFDNSMALTAVSALKNIGICAEECSARVDKYGRTSLEIKLKRDNDTVLNKLQIMRMLSLSCERDFDVPSITHSLGDTFISLNEHAALRVDIGVHQETAAGSSMCGDAYNYFLDGKGHFIMILSDGMGTGGRAAVDGAMASGLMARLLKAGFGYNCSLRILNSSMLFKSTDESLSTVDIASIDLFSGEALLYKAGAAPTVVRRGGKCGRAESTSLPVGILREIGFDRAGIRLRSGDILLLLSDGATTDGTDWIRAELEAWREGNAQELAEHITRCARRRCSSPARDDITVMAAILEKAV